jgi:nucleoside-diphosphate-sugar epimerase
MLCDQFAKRNDVSRIITLDKEPQSDFSKTIPKLEYIQANMADDGWEEKVAAFAPDTVIHTAWQIRAMYGNAKEQWRWNIEGSDKVFAFAFDTSSVQRLVYFSTASSYAARSTNTFEHRFTEKEGFREDSYVYAREKKVAEEHLHEAYRRAKEAGGHMPNVFIIRPAAITGPRGRYMRMRFGLQSALQGNLKGSFVYRIVTMLTAFVPATKGWVRQFVHEDDVTDAVALFTFDDPVGAYEAFNLTPPGEPVYAQDMAAAVGKKVLPLKPWMVRLAFWFFWHATRGRIPTCAGSWRFYSYPILMDGSKLSTQYGYTYRYNSRDAFRYTAGRYEPHVPEESRNHAP